MTHVLTLVGPPGTLTPSLIAAATAAAAGGAPTLLSAAEAVDIPCPTPPALDAIRAALGAAPIDAVVTPAHNRRKRLLVADMDSTIVTSETLDELAAYAGVGEHVAAITRRSMNGEIDFADALRERVALLKGLTLDALDRTYERVQLTPGARQLVGTMRAHGAYAALVSGGFTWFTSRIGARAGFDTHRSNILLDDGAALLGRVQEPVLDRDAKLAALLGFAGDRGLSPEDCLAVGDGANDLAMIGAAGLGVAYHAKPLVAAAAGARIEHCDLTALLFIQGYRRDEFRE